MNRSPTRAAACCAVLSFAPQAWAAGTVTVRSDVPGQSVMVDGTDIGMVTPATVAGLSAGRHVVQVVGGCRFGVAAVEVVEGETVPVLVETRAKQGSLALQLTPPDAEVRIDGLAVEVGAAPLPVACGAHSVSVSKPGHLPLLINVDVEAGQRLDLPLTLVAQGQGELTVDVTPDDASVFLDGAPVGQGDLAGLVLPAGPHTVRAEAEGYDPDERQFVLENDASMALVLPLTAVAGATPGVASAAAGPTAAPVPAAEPAAVSRSRLAGVSLTAGGAGLGILAAVQLSRMTAYGAEYQDRADKVLATNDASVLAPAYANDFREDTLLPQRNRAVATTTIATALLAAGLTLTLAF